MSATKGMEVSIAASVAAKLARVEAERWVRIALDPIMTRIREHKQHLDTRLTSLKHILENMGTLQGRMAQLKQEIERLRQDKVELERIAETFAA